MSANHYNLALLPESSLFSRNCIELAQNNLFGQASEYILGPALPHITLCQFQAPAQPEELAELWSALKPHLPASMTISFSHIYLKPGQNDHLGKYWVGLAVKAAPNIFSLQETCFELLAENGIKSRTSADDYFPHLTLARCRADGIGFQTLPGGDFFHSEHRFLPSLGLSDPNGVYIKPIFTIGKF